MMLIYAYSACCFISIIRQAWSGVRDGCFEWHVSHIVHVLLCNSLRLGLASLEGITVCMTVCVSVFISLHIGLCQYTALSLSLPIINKYIHDTFSHIYPRLYLFSSFSFPLICSSSPPLCIIFLLAATSLSPSLSSLSLSCRFELLSLSLPFFFLSERSSLSLRVYLCAYMRV